MTHDDTTLEQTDEQQVTLYPPFFPPPYVRGNEQGLSPEQITTLSRPISHARVATRVDSGKQLSYVQAWDVKATLVKVFGFGGFSADLIGTEILYVGEKKQTSSDRMNAVVVVRATVRLTIHATGATYTETATGQNAQPDIGKAYDTAFKSAESDALKRAALYLGTQFGLSLYAKTKDDICRPVLEPTQAEAIRQATAAPVVNEEVASMLDRATTPDPSVGVAEDADAEAAAMNPNDLDTSGPDKHDWEPGATR